MSSLHRDGSEVGFDVGFGVFVVTSTPTERVREYFEQYSGSGLYTASDGKYQVFYRPYHLPGIETGVSVASAAIRNEPTGVADRQVAEVVGDARLQMPRHAAFRVRAAAQVAVDFRCRRFHGRPSFSLRRSAS